MEEDYGDQTGWDNGGGDPTLDPTQGSDEPDLIDSYLGANRSSAEEARQMRYIYQSYLYDQLAENQRQFTMRSAQGDRQFAAQLEFNKAQLLAEIGQNDRKIALAEKALQQSGQLATGWYQPSGAPSGGGAPAQAAGTATGAAALNLPTFSPGAMPMPAAMGGGMRAMAPRPPAVPAIARPGGGMIAGPVGPQGQLSHFAQNYNPGDPRVAGQGSPLSGGNAYGSFGQREFQYGRPYEGLPDSVLDPWQLDVRYNQKANDVWTPGAEQMAAILAAGGVWNDAGQLQISGQGGLDLATVLGSGPDGYGMNSFDPGASGGYNGPEIPDSGGGDYQGIEPGYQEDGYTFNGGDAGDDNNWTPNDEFARGGRSDGGPALVGEYGPEKLHLPRGARVIPIKHGPWEKYQQPALALLGRR